MFFVKVLGFFFLGIQAELNVLDFTGHEVVTWKRESKSKKLKTAMDILQTHQSPLLPETTSSLFHSAKERLVSGATTLARYYFSSRHELS